jgi:hypothetical protein
MISRTTQSWPDGVAIEITEVTSELPQIGETLVRWPGQPDEIRAQVIKIERKFDPYERVSFDRVYVQYHERNKPLVESFAWGHSPWKQEAQHANQ